MDDRYTRDQLDAIAHSVADIHITLAKLTVIVDEHQKRSVMLETQMEAVMAHINGLKGVIKALKILAILAAIAEGIRIAFH